MKNSNAVKTNSTFWSQLEADIDKYTHKAKKNIKIYQNQTYDKPLRKMKDKFKQYTEQLISNPSISSLNTIRSRINQQKKKQKIMNNRLKYMKVQKNRKLQYSQLVKKKYQKVQSIRSQSLKDKQFIKNEISSYKENDLHSQKQKANKVKSERWKIGESIENKKKLTIISAQRVRAQSAKNQRIIHQKMIQDIQNNKLKAKKVQTQQQINRKKLQQLQKQKIMNGKINYNKKVWDSYKTYQLRHRKNKKIFQNFKQEAQLIEMQVQKAQIDLMTYSDLLGLKRKNNIKANQSRNQSFYVTLN